MKKEITFTKWTMSKKETQCLAMLLKYAKKCTLCGEPIDLTDRDSYMVDWSDEDGLGRFYFHKKCIEGDEAYEELPYAW